MSSDDHVAAPGRKTPSITARALYFPRTRFHFRELRWALEGIQDKAKAKGEWHGLGKSENQWNDTLQIHIDKIRKAWENTKVSRSKGDSQKKPNSLLVLKQEPTIDYKSKRTSLSTHREWMAFSIEDKTDRKTFSCEYYSPGLLIVHNPGDISNGLFGEITGGIFRGLFAGFPYVTQAIERLGNVWGDCYFDPIEEKITKIFVLCCDSFAEKLVETFRQPRVANRLSQPKNPKGQIWPSLNEGAPRNRTSAQDPLQRETESEILDDELLYAFDAAEYLQQVKDSLTYFNNFIKNFAEDQRDPHGGEIEPGNKDFLIAQQNVDFLNKWAMMRRERAKSIFEIERNSGQVVLGKIVGVLTYETIALTLVQIERTLISNPPIVDFLLPWIMVILFPFIPIATGHYFADHWRARVLGYEFGCVILFFSPIIVDFLLPALGPVVPGWIPYVALGLVFPPFLYGLYRDRIQNPANRVFAFLKSRLLNYARKV